MKYSPLLTCQLTYMWARSSVQPTGMKYYLAFSVPADIYVVLLQVSSRKPGNIIAPLGVPADIYFLLLEAVQLTGMRYYPTSSMPADIYVGPLQAVQLTALKYYLLSWRASRHYAPSV